MLLIQITRSVCYQRPLDSNKCDSACFTEQKDNDCLSSLERKPVGVYFSVLYCVPLGIQLKVTSTQLSEPYSSHHIAVCIIAYMIQRSDYSTVCQYHITLEHVSVLVQAHMSD